MSEMKMFGSQGTPEQIKDGEKVLSSAEKKGSETQDEMIEKLSKIIGNVEIKKIEELNALEYRAIVQEYKGGNLDLMKKFKIVIKGNIAEHEIKFFRTEHREDGAEYDDRVVDGYGGEIDKSELSEEEAKQLFEKYNEAHDLARLLIKNQDNTVKAVGHERERAVLVQQYEDEQNREQKTKENLGASIEDLMNY